MLPCRSFFAIAKLNYLSLEFGGILDDKGLESYRLYRFCRTSLDRLSFCGSGPVNIWIHKHKHHNNIILKALILLLVVFYRRFLSFGFCSKLKSNSKETIDNKWFWKSVDTLMVKTGTVLARPKNFFPYLTLSYKNQFTLTKGSKGQRFFS